MPNPITQSLTVHCRGDPVSLPFDLLSNPRSSLRRLDLGRCILSLIPSQMSTTLPNLTQLHLFDIAPRQPTSTILELLSALGRLEALSLQRCLEKNTSRTIQDNNTIQLLNLASLDLCDDYDAIALFHRIIHPATTFTHLQIWFTDADKPNELSISLLDHIIISRNDSSSPRKCMSLIMRSDTLHICLWDEPVSPAQWCDLPPSGGASPAPARNTIFLGCRADVAELFGVLCVQNLETVYMDSWGNGHATRDWCDLFEAHPQVHSVYISAPHLERITTALSWARVEPLEYVPIQCGARSDWTEDETEPNQDLISMYGAGLLTPKLQVLGIAHMRLKTPWDALHCMPLHSSSRHASYSISRFDVSC